MHFQYSEPETWVEIVHNTFEKEGRSIPARNKAKYFKVKDLEETDYLQDVFDDIWQDEGNGVWISLNPLHSPDEFKGKAASDDDVAEYCYALVECDDISREKQWEFMYHLHLPIQSVVWSGGKSLHAVIRIGADFDKVLYKERVSRLYEYLEFMGMPVDKANRNPSRLTRLPGFRRGEQLQYTVSTGLGPEDWESFEPYIDLALDSMKSSQSEKMPTPVFQSMISRMRKDARSISSIINGMKGGRPEMPVTKLAEEFFQTQKDEQDRPLLHHWCNEWYQYDIVKKHWEILGKSELEMRLAGYLQRQQIQNIGRISNNLIRDILVNLKADTLAGLPAQQYQMPCWVPEGAPADDWMCCKNQMVCVRRMIKGQRIPFTQSLTPEYFGTHYVDYEYQSDA